MTHEQKIGLVNQIKVQLVKITKVTTNTSHGEKELEKICAEIWNLADALLGDE